MSETQTKPRPYWFHDDSEQNRHRYAFFLEFAMMAFFGCMVLYERAWLHVLFSGTFALFACHSYCNWRQKPEVSETHKLSNRQRALVIRIQAAITAVAALGLAMWCFLGHQYITAAFSAALGVATLVIAIKGPRSRTPRSPFTI